VSGGAQDVDTGLGDARRVLLTGASGFIGRQAIAPLLARGYEVHAVSRRGSTDAVEGETDEVHWHSVDLLSAMAPDELMREIAPTHMLHFAWYAEHGRFWGSAENVRWLEASLRLLRAFEARGGRRAVLAGTCAEYDWSVAGRCVEDVTPLAPATLYGRSKHALHSLIEALWEPEGSPSVAWGRIFFLYGPHEHPARLVPSVINALLNGENARCSHGRQKRDFLHVADVAKAFAALLDSPLRGAVNIGSGESVTIAEVIAMVGEVCGRQELVQLGALPTRPDEPDELVADTARLSDDVGFAPTLTLGEGIHETVDWWRWKLDQLV
jgi:nucleoside-diphosphate-sugar epimerase